MEGSEDLKDRRRLSTLPVVLLQILFLWLYVRSTAKVIYGREKLRKKEKPAPAECQNITFAGFNVTSTSSFGDKGMRSIVLEDVALVDGWLVGVVATASRGSCPFNLQLWNRTGLLSYQLMYEKAGISYIDPGQYQYDLGYSDYFYTSSALKLGFTSTSSSDTCVAYKSITDLSQRSQTFMYEFSTAPVVGSTYSFLPFQITRHYGVMAVLSDVKPPRKTLYTLGFDTPRTTVLDSSKAKHAILLTGVNLMFGHLRSFTVKSNRNGCSVYLQIWSSVNATTHSWALKYQSPLQKIPVPGENVIPTHLSVVLYPTDRIGFLDVSTTPCVVYEYNVLSLRFSDTGLLDFSSSPIPSVGNTYDFLPFQRTHRFAVSVQVSTVIPPPQTGPKGKRGEIGKTGPSGPKGDTGDSGDKGPSGIKGEIGDRGNTGLPGSVGNSGSDGPVGKSGDPGQKGDRGLPGISGIGGKSGENGETGSAGNKGNPGTVTGEAGSPGDTGSAGSKGDIGSPGGRGDVGVLGVTGGRGIRGSAGDKGTKGVAASNGIAGIKGFKGEQGMRGDMWDPKSKDWCKVPHCEHHCKNTGLSYACSCREGYKLVTNSGNCMDVNECDYNNGHCQYTCTNTVGSYSCSCPSGYTLAKDNHRCNDIDECTDGTNNCASGEICINTWDGFVCLGSYTKSTLASTQVIDTSVVVTKSMFIGLFIWLVVVTLILLVEISFLMPEFFKKESDPNVDL